MILKDFWLTHGSVLWLSHVIKLNWCEALPPCAKHREGDRCRRQWWRVVLLLIRFMRIKNYNYHSTYINFSIIKNKPKTQVNYSPPFRINKQITDSISHGIYCLLAFNIFKKWCYSIQLKKISKWTTHHQKQSFWSPSLSAKADRDERLRRILTYTPCEAL